MAHAIRFDYGHSCDFGALSFREKTPIAANWVGRECRLEGANRAIQEPANHVASMIQTGRPHRSWRIAET
jgi:hypothetical protein